MPRAREANEISVWRCDDADDADDCAAYCDGGAPVLTRSE